MVTYMVNEGQQNSSIPIGHASPVLPSSFLLQQDNFNPFLQNSEKSSETRTKGVSGSFDNGIGSLDSFKLNPETDWRVQSRQSKSRANLLSMGGGGNNEELPFASLSLKSPEVVPPRIDTGKLLYNNNNNNNRSKFNSQKGIEADYAPSIVISSLASRTIDHDYNYAGGYRAQNKNGVKPMTAKDRARHGMLRTMLKKSLEVTRPSWPKHPNFQSTDRVLDEEEVTRRRLRTRQKMVLSMKGTGSGSGSGSGNGSSLHSMGFVSPTKSPTKNICGSVGGSVGSAEPFKSRSPPKTAGGKGSPKSPQLSNSMLMGSFTGFEDREGEGEGSGYEIEFDFSLGGVGGIPTSPIRLQGGGGGYMRESPSAQNLSMMKDKDVLNPFLKIHATSSSLNINLQKRKDRKELGMYKGTRSVRKVHR